MASNWLGAWDGDWFGALEPAPPGSVSGTASLHLSASGTIESAAGPRWISGTSHIQIGASGTIESAAGPRWISGTSHLQFGAAGTIADANAAPTVTQPAGSAGCGGWDTTGTGYVWKDHAWVKATKVARSGVSAHWLGSATSKVAVGSVPIRMTTNRTAGRTRVETLADSRPESLVATLPTAIPRDSHSFSLTKPALSIVSTYNGACETLSIDEIIALMGMAA